MLCPRATRTHPRLPTTSTSYALLLAPDELPREPAGRPPTPGRGRPLPVVRDGRHAVEALPALLDGYGHRPAWPERHTAMLLKCAALRDVCLRRGDESAAEMWSERATVTSGWRAL